MGQIKVLHLTLDILTMTICGRTVGLWNSNVLSNMSGWKRINLYNWLSPILPLSLSIDCNNKTKIHIFLSIIVSKFLLIAKSLPLHVCNCFQVPPYSKIPSTALVLFIISKQSLFYPYRIDCCLTSSSNYFMQIQDENP